MEAGRLAGGSSCAQRLDPFSLPVRFSAADEAADQRLRIIDLHRERVVFRRSVRGMRMTLNLPVTAFRGIAIRLVLDGPDKVPSAIAVVLEHADPALSLPLFSSTAPSRTSTESETPRTAMASAASAPARRADATSRSARSLRAD